MENNSAEDSSGPSGAVTGESAKKSQQELLRTVPRMSLFDFVSSFDVLPPTDGSNQLWKWLGRTQKGVVKKQLCYRSERFGVQRQEKQEVVSTLQNTQEVARFFRGHLHWYCPIPEDLGPKFGFDCLFSEEFAKKKYPIGYCAFTVDECKVVLRRALRFFMSKYCYVHWYRHKAFAPLLN